MNSQDSDAQNIEPGMQVETTNGDLGEADASKPKVTDVVRLIFWANVLAGVLSPILVIYLVIGGLLHLEYHEKEKTETALGYIARL